MEKKLAVLPSIMCSTPQNMKAYVQAFEACGIDAIHFDVMDGHYVPNIMLGLRDYQFIKSITDLPVDIHLMCESPEAFVEYLNPQEGDWVSFHPETTRHPYRLLQSLRAKGCRAGIALSPGSPISYVEEMAGVLDFVLVMAVNPGFAGQKIVPDHLDKLRRIRESIQRSERNIAIYVDGNTNAVNTQSMIAAGADGVVAGTSSMLKEGPEKFVDYYRMYMKEVGEGNFA